MNVLYLGGHRRRFHAVTALLEDIRLNSRILELCFGDTYIADYCRGSGYRWEGLDINRQFVERAQKLGYDARYADLTMLEKLPQAEVCVMMGAFYHFHLQAERMLAQMFQAADTVVISEPVSNLASQKGLIGFLARRAANAGKGNEQFRYDQATLVALLQENRHRLNYSIVSAQRRGKELIVKLVKNADNRP